MPEVDGPAEGSAVGSGDVSADVSAVASLDEPTRRRIYDHVRTCALPVSRDDVADALDLPRQTAAFHLDRLAGLGLLAVSFARRTGRSGPGAGRPAKLYRRSAREVSVTLPPRHYDLAGRLLAGAVAESQSSGEAPREVLDRHARELGRAMSCGRSGEGDADVLTFLLEEQGFEPRLSGGAIVLHNCPFHALVKDHAELVCGMSLRLIEGVVDGIGSTRLRPRLDPGPSHCCVRVELADRD